MSNHLSQRGAALAVEKDDEGVRHHFEALSDLHDAETNPAGYINMGAAESHLVDDEIIALVTAVHSRGQLQSRHMHYDWNFGSDELRTEIAKHRQKLVFQRHTERVIDKDNIVISTGCTLILDMLATMLGDPGDVFLLPAPYYASFEFDINNRPGVEAVSVQAGAELEIESFEKALAEQKTQGKNVRAVLLASPNNPVGTVYSAETLSDLIEFCVNNDLELIADEMYGETVFDPASQWHSVLDLVPDAHLQRVHAVGGFAKDFAMSGLKVGFAVSFNPALIDGLRTLSNYAPVSTHTQFLLAELLKAPELSTFMQANNDKLRATYALTRSLLDDMGIRSRPAQAGMFLLADFSRFLESKTFEAELALIGKLHDEHKVNLAPGLAYGTTEPGWIRICYAFGDDTIKELFRRLQTLPTYG